MGTGRSFQENKATRVFTLTTHSSGCISECKNEWNYTSAAPRPVVQCTDAALTNSLLCPFLYSLFQRKVPRHRPYFSLVKFDMNITS